VTLASDSNHNTNTKGISIMKGKKSSKGSSKTAYAPVVSKNIPLTGGSGGGGKKKKGK